MPQIVQNEFHIGAIMDSGQVFRIRRLDGGAAGGPKQAHCIEASAIHCMAIAGNHAVVIHQKENIVTFDCSEEEFENFWYEYFDLGRDYGQLMRSIDPEDSFLNAAAQYGQGLRMLKQDLWETIISFLISQNNNIPRIRKSIEALCERFGKKITVPGLSERGMSEGDLSEYALSETVSAFPTPEALCRDGIDGLSGLGLGYRDKYILRMAQRCCGQEGQEWLGSLKSCDYAGAVSLLVQEFGIGRKVANCICLFALHHVDAFPVDTHVRQIFALHYPQGFPFERYTGYAGILQQYMFYYKLTGLT